jgi:hypothetical protein
MAAQSLGARMADVKTGMSINILFETGRQ